MRSVYDNILPVIAVDARLAGSTASTSVVIDTRGHNSAMLVVKATGSAGAPTSSQVVASITECDTSSGTFTAASDVGGTAIAATAVNTSGDAQAAARIEGLNLQRKRFIKVVLTPTFVGGTNPAFTATAVLLLDRSTQLPVTTTTSNT